MADCPPEPEGGHPHGRERKLDLPPTAPRPSHLEPPVQQVEVDLNTDAAPPVHAVVPAAGVAEARAELQRALRDLPRLATGYAEGGVDIRLENAVAEVVKNGTVVLDGPGGPVAVALDPATRRFRRGGLAPGTYRVHATSATGGRSQCTVEVRAAQVTRAALALDGRPLEGTSSVRLAIQGTQHGSVRIQARDNTTGAALLDADFEILGGVVVIDELPIGAVHLDVSDDNGRRGCYDADTDDSPFLVGTIELAVFDPLHRRRREPDPPDWFTLLPAELHGTWPVLRELGVQSLEQLAAEEPEGLMHRALEANLALHSRAFASVVESARVAAGLPGFADGARVPLRLGSGATAEASLRLDAAGEVTVDVDLTSGEGALLIEWPGGSRQFDIAGRRRVSIDVPPSERDQPLELKLQVTNRSDERLAGALVAKLPTTTRPEARVRTTTRQHLASILSSLAERNPGISTAVADAMLLPDNLAGWVDHARAAMHSVRVCSLDDLGPLRMTPMQKLHPGAYIAPARVPDVIPALSDWAFSHVVSDTILYYVPNETLHDTALVLASEWDIRGQTVVIGSDVHELLVVVDSIGYNGTTSITWEHPTLAAGPAYWPSPAANGGDGLDGTGRDGGPGGDGDASPSRSKNGGADADVDAPIVTLYVRNATGGLPPIDLRGQRGGAGGRGQDGGRGGNGGVGRRADGFLFTGCCRGVGWGGNGGRGGSGGRGGEGGRGGMGGRITVLTSPASVAAIDVQHPALDVNPGAGGPGGPAGDQAAGGSGGAAGTADCETWCSEHPERHGSIGGTGPAGAVGPAGGPGPAPLGDALQFLPITDAQWKAQFNSPHIFSVTPLVAEPGDHISISGNNFLPGGDRVYYDGSNVGPVKSATAATFDVPLTAEGGFHPIVVRPASDPDRRSNKVLLQILPKVTALSPETRWTEATKVKISGRAFRAGCTVTAEDWSQTPHALFKLPVASVARTAIALSVPASPLGNLRGVRRIRVTNPEGGVSRDEHVARIGDTIVVRVAAFRLVGSVTGVSTDRSAAEIANLFTDGPATSISIPWAAARISFQLAQAVIDLKVKDSVANVFPRESGGTHPTWDAVLGPAFVPGALNILFARDVEAATAYAQFGGGPIVFGDEPGYEVTPTDLQQIVAHEVGHALCLRHICSVGTETGTFFDRACETSDQGFLMYPHWNVSDVMALDPGQVPIARRGATYVETGKTQPLAYGALFKGSVPARCKTDDATS